MLLLAAVAYCVLLTSVSGFSIDPSRLLIATVVDISKPSIVADSLLLFRSIRLFGGAELSEATLLACIVADPKHAFADDILLSKFTALGVELDFVRQINAPFARTMNKFSSFYRMSARFDHFLWLDADVFVLGDPMPLLRSVDWQEGKIYCVPEMNNYMVRFPGWNHSTLSLLAPHHALGHLQPFHLLGESEPAPHGICNMGVLLFDSISLSLLLRLLSDHEAMRAVQTHVKDRFLDSLCFVLGVYSGGIEVVRLPGGGALNYFVLLEEEVAAVQTEAQTEVEAVEGPLFAHFMADSSLEVYDSGAGDGDSACSCAVLRDQPLAPSSMIEKMIAERCPALCQQEHHLSTTRSDSDSVVNSSHLSEVASSSEQINSTTSNFMQLLWPEQGIILFSVLNKFTVDIVVQHSSDTGLPLSLWLSNTSAFSLSSVQTECSSSVGSCHSLLHVRATLIPAARKIPHMSVTITVRFTLAPSITQEVLLRVVSRDHQAFSHTGFSRRLQHGNLPFALSSQLQLPFLLNLRSLHNMGVVLCCDTDAGLGTTKRLIRDWGHRIRLDTRLRMGGLSDGRLLLVALQGSHPRGMRAIAKELADYCDSRVEKRSMSGLGKEHLLGCVLVEAEDVFDAVSADLRRNRAHTLSFVYTDVFTSHASYAHFLRQWYPALSPGGILAGSRFYHSRPTSGSDGLNTSTAEFPAVATTAIQVKNAVEACAHLWSTPVFVTHFEIMQPQVEAVDAAIFADQGSDSYFDTADKSHHFPAWYLFNNDRSFS